jgi:hypothetical protein
MSETQLRIDEPSRFIGRYQDAASNDQLEVASDACGLYLDDARHTRLISRPDGGFLVAAMDVEVSFSQQDGAGRFRRLDLHGSLPGLSPLWTRVEGQR